MTLRPMANPGAREARAAPRRRHPALQQLEGVESLRWWGAARLIYACVWLLHRVHQSARHADAPPRLLGAEAFEFRYDPLLAAVHIAFTAALLPLVAAQLYGTTAGSRLHRLSGAAGAALTVASVPWNLALLAEDRYGWPVATFVELLVLSQWCYHLRGLLRSAGDRKLHGWHGVQFIRIWLTPVRSACAPDHPSGYSDLAHSAWHGRSMFESQQQLQCRHSRSILRLPLFLVILSRVQSGSGGYHQCRRC